MSKRSSKQPDPSEIARSVLDAVVPDAEPKLRRGSVSLASFKVAATTGSADLIEDDNANAKNPAAVAIGRLGGKIGGPARALRLSSEEKKAIATKAAKARWKKQKPKP